MLVLSRKAGETLVINGKIRVTVLKLRGKAVRLGIDAPKDIRVKREGMLRKEKPATAQTSSAVSASKP